MICYWSVLDSPIGMIYLAATDKGLIYCGNSKENEKEMYNWISKSLPDHKLEKSDNPILIMAKEQLKDYFKGESEILDVPLILIGTSFRKTVWKALKTIPYGETCTYGEIAEQIGNPKAARAVGQANNKNPISYFVPWHRVIGASGALVGFGGGLDIKSWLLELEGISHNYKK